MLKAICGIYKRRFKREARAMKGSSTSRTTTNHSILLVRSPVPDPTFIDVYCALACLKAKNIASIVFPCLRSAFHRISLLNKSHNWPVYLCLDLFKRRVDLCEIIINIDFTVLAEEEMEVMHAFNIGY